MSQYWPKELQKVGEVAAKVEYLAQQITVLKHRVRQYRDRFV